MPAALPLARRAHHEFEVAVQLDGRNIKAQRDLIAFTANAPEALGGGEERALEQIRALSAVGATEGMLALADLHAVQKKFDQADAEYQKILASAPDRIDISKLRITIGTGASPRPSNKLLSVPSELRLQIGASAITVVLHWSWGQEKQRPPSRTFAHISATYPRIPSSLCTHRHMSGSENSTKTKTSQNWRPSSIRLLSPSIRGTRLREKR